MLSIPNFFKWFPPTDKYSISGFWDFNLEITVEANLSPEGSPVSINIFFQSQIIKEYDQ